MTERLRLLITAGMLLIASRATITTAPQDQPIFRTAIQTVPVYATVFDTRGRLVPDLRETDFTVLDNGRPTSLSLFSSSPRPFTVVVMLDTSASMASNLEFLKNAAAEFLNRLQETDQAQVGAFNERVELSGRFTNDRAALLEALTAFDVGNPTKLYDGVAASLDALSAMTGRRIILVFSDGDDTASRVTFDTVLARARDDEVMVYAIGLESSYFNGERIVRTRPAKDLKKIAEATGGGYFELTKTADLSPTFGRVVDELRSQYLLGIAPSAPLGRTHQLEVRVSRPGMTVRARKSYLAAPPAR